MNIQKVFPLPYNSCWLTVHDKCPGLRPIGIGEVLRQIIGRIIAKCIKTDHRITGGDQKLCMGQKRRNEFAFHSKRAAFKNTDLKAIMLIDLKNAFNSLTVDLALRDNG